MVFLALVPSALTSVGEAARQSLTDGAGQLGKRHLDARTAVRPKLTLQALILLTSDHKHILLAIRRNAKGESREHSRIQKRIPDLHFIRFVTRSCLSKAGDSSTSSSSGLMVSRSPSA